MTLTSTVTISTAFTLLSTTGAAQSTSRALMAVDTSTLNPFADVCGATIGATTIAASSGLRTVLTCSTGAAASSPINGVAATYGSTSIASFGYLVLTAASNTANTLVIDGTLTTATGSFIDVTFASSPAAGETFYLIRWNETSCTDVTPQVVTTGCTSCTVAVTSDSALGVCYLTASAGSTSDDSDENLYFLFFLFLIPILLVPVYFVMKKPKAQAQQFEQQYEMPADDWIYAMPVPSAGYEGYAGYEAYEGNDVYYTDEFGNPVQ
jgi:hypothetical protein